MKKYIVIVVAIGLFGCSRQKQDQQMDSTIIAKYKAFVAADTTNHFSDYHDYITRASVSDGGVQTIDSTCAVMINPTDEQIEAMTKEMSEDEFATVADDASFYMSFATTKLNSFHIKIVQAEKPFLKVRSKNESFLLDIRQKNAPAWNVILFRSGKEPEVLSRIEVYGEPIQSYFDIQ